MIYFLFGRRSVGRRLEQRILNGLPQVLVARPAPTQVPARVYTPKPEQPPAPARDWYDAEQEYLERLAVLSDHADPLRAAHEALATPTGDGTVTATCYGPHHDAGGPA